MELTLLEEKRQESLLLEQPIGLMILMKLCADDWANDFTFLFPTLLVGNNSWRE